MMQLRVTNKGLAQNCTPPVFGPVTLLRRFTKPFQSFQISLPLLLHHLRKINVASLADIIYLTEDSQRATLRNTEQMVLCGGKCFLRCIDSNLQKISRSHRDYLPSLFVPVCLLRRVNFIPSASSPSCQPLRPRQEPRRTTLWAGAECSSGGWKLPQPPRSSRLRRQPLPLRRPHWRIP